jgi:hypothetical protein
VLLLGIEPQVETRHQHESSGPLRGWSSTSDLTLLIAGLGIVSINQGRFGPNTSDLVFNHRQDNVGCPESAGGFVTPRFVLDPMAPGADSLDCSPELESAKFQSTSARR